MFQTGRSGDENRASDRSIRRKRRVPAAVRAGGWGVTFILSLKRFFGFFLETVAGDAHENIIE